MSNQYSGYPLNPDPAYLKNYGGDSNPSPWYSVANQFLPRNLHDVIRWARYITIQSPTVTEVIRKKVTYPITDFIVQTDNHNTKSKYEEIFKTLRLKSQLHDIGFEHETIGNVFVSIYFPIIRNAVCPNCHTSYPVKKSRNITFKNFEYRGECAKCGHVGPMHRRDVKSMTLQDFNIIKWNPNNISVHYNPVTGESDYYYTIPNEIRNKIRSGDRLYVDTMPWELVESVQKAKDFKFDKGNLFHMRNMSSGHMIDGIAVPPLISTFNLVFYQATLRKANESIAMEHMVPLRVVYPQNTNSGRDAVAQMSMQSFVGNMEDAIKRHKRDNNHFLIAPMAIGYQNISGEGKALLVNQEIAQAEQTLLLSMGVSQELLSGTSNWTSSTVGLRMLASSLEIYVGQMEELIQWISDKIARYLNIEVCKVSLAPFSLLDDDLRRQALLALEQAGKISTSTMLESYSIDPAEEMKRMEEDAAAKATLDIKIGLATAKAQFLASREVQEVMQKDTDFSEALAQAQQLAEQLYMADEATRRQMLGQLKTTNYPLYLMASKLMEEMSRSPEAKQAEQVGKEALMGQGEAQGEEMGGSGQGGDPNATEAVSGPSGDDGYLDPNQNSQSDANSVDTYAQPSLAVPRTPKSKGL